MTPGSIQLLSIAAILCLPACASRLSDYPGHFSDKTRAIEIGGEKRMVTHHKSEPLLLVYLPLTKAVPVGLASGATLGAISADTLTSKRNAELEQYAIAYLGEACTITHVDNFSDGLYELAYECGER